MGEVDWEKRARELLPNVVMPNYGGHDIEVPMSLQAARQMALQLGREMADARAEEIANLILRRYHLIAKQAHTTSKEHEKYERGILAGLEQACEVARSCAPKPRTREAVLEEALREIADSTSKDNIYGDQKRLTAKRALEWRPDK